MDPVAHGHSTPSLNVRSGKITLHRHMRRTAEIHHYFALPLLIAPRHHRDVGRLRTEPRLRTVRPRPHRIPSNRLTTKYPLPTRQMTRRPNHSRPRRRARIRAGHRAHFIVHPSPQMPDT